MEAIAAFGRARTKDFYRFDPQLHLRFDGNATRNAEIKQERWERFMDKQNQISAEKLKNKIGRTLEVLIDEVNDNEAIGRGHADAPEIDGQVIIVNTDGLNPGDRVKVMIEASGDYDLWGKIAK